MQNGSCLSGESELDIVSLDRLVRHSHEHDRGVLLRGYRRDADALGVKHEPLLLLFASLEAYGHVVHRAGVRVPEGDADVEHLVHVDVLVRISVKKPDLGEFELRI